MDKRIPQPRNRTALMQHFQRLVTTGHYFWCADQIPYSRLQPLIDKWHPELALRADAPARAYRKQCGKASVHLCPDTGLAKDAVDSIAWWMLSTDGKHGLANHAHPPAAVRDCRTEAGRLRLGDYELLQLERRPTPTAKATTTWTWRLTAQRYKAWEAWIAERAKARDVPSLELIQASLSSMPMFSGIRDQIGKLLREMSKLMGKMKLTPFTYPPLPSMRMLTLWKDEPGF